jgi:hypothetical protein
LRRGSIFGWLGATNKHDAGIVSWLSSGNEVDIDGEGNFTRWKHDEPRGVDDHDDDDCLSIKSDNTMWHDTKCRRENHAVCQYRFQRIPIDVNIDMDFDF